MENEIPTTSTKKAPFWLAMGIILDVLALALLTTIILLDPGNLGSYVLTAVLIILSVFAYIRWKKGSKLII